MKVILLQDIENIGKRFEVKNVKDGYARNFLIPNGMAKLATEEAIKWVEMQKEILGKQIEEELKTAQDAASKLDGLEIIIPVKLGDQGQFFEKINAQKIADKIKEMGFEVKKTQVELNDPLGELGEFPIKIKLDHNLEAEVKIILTEEK